MHFRKKSTFFLFSLLFSGVLLYSLEQGWAESANEEPKRITVLELNQQIKDKKSKIANLRKQIDDYEKNIRNRRAEAASLENEIVLIEDEAAKTNLALEATVDEIEQLDLEIQQVTLEIGDKEADIAIQKERLAEYLRQLYEKSEKGYLEILLLNDSFSDFFDQVHYLELAQADVQGTVIRIKELREQLVVAATTLENNKQRQEELKASLEEQKAILDEQRGAKQSLIVQSVLSAEKYEQLLSEARSEQAGIDSDIGSLEKRVRERLNLFTGGPVNLSWPVDPTRGISALFHDPGYPFRHVFEHPAVDIRAYQGTYVRAAESGYVGRVKQGGKAYSYTMILHDKGLATVYGHMSRIIVEEDSYVKKGQVIGLSGGSPGTNGAGNLTTGPHLHFEVRLHGIPVDPLDYLP
ncbi:MAG: peptidoglycan DD-metalloendopeptidase family protein [bacterium]|nr:peptidoglycan DD-metalloendopeptidase family protein [bacterium]